MLQKALNFDNFIYNFLEIRPIFSIFVLTKGEKCSIISPKIILYKLVKGEKNMKSTGVVRKVDELGRIVLPKELRTILNINEKDSIEIFTDDDKIILQKYQPACTFCNNVNNIIYFSGKRVCAACVEKLKQQL